MQSRHRKRDLIINLLFGLSLLILMIPDALLYDDISNPCRFKTDILDTLLDVSLFITVFIFLKIEIHQHRIARERLEILNRHQTEFLQIVAHDLRNPLNAITQIAALLPPDEREAAQSIRDTASEMLEVINSMLEIAALEKGKIRLHPTEGDLVEVVGEVLERNRPYAQRKRISLSFSSPESCLAKFDQGRIRQAVDNLVSNAIKFSPSDKVVSITVKTGEGWVRIEVADQGPGLTSEDKTCLFQRFMRLSAQPTGGESSLGIGLANARQLVELHGGHIGAESAGTGKGSLFWIELPEG